MQGLLAVELVKSYHRRRVVNRVSISVREGEVVGLLGPNGAGKTTVFSMLVGLEVPEHGKIFLRGKDVTGLPMHLRAQQGIGYLPQEASIFRKLTVYENLIAVLEMSHLSRSEQERKAEALMAELDVESLRNARGDSLSGGERRRVEICRALATSPTFILLDEPFSGIDPIAVQELQKILSRLRAKRIGLLVTDHNVRETLAITDRAYIINEGDVLVSGAPQEVAQSAQARQIYFGDQFQMGPDTDVGAPAASWETLGADDLFQTVLASLLNGQEEVVVSAQEVVRVAERVWNRPNDFITETWVHHQMRQHGVLGSRPEELFRKYVAGGGMRRSIDHYRIRRSRIRMPSTIR